MSDPKHKQTCDQFKEVSRDERFSDFFVIVIILILYGQHVFILLFFRDKGDLVNYTGTQSFIGTLSHLFIEILIGWYKLAVSKLFHQ